MSTPLLHKYNSVAGTAPAAGSLVPRELAINTAEGRLFTKTNAGNVVEFARKSDIPSSTPGGVTVGDILVNTTAVAGTKYVFLATLTLTLPASPAPGDVVGFSNRSGGTACVIARNGQNIMGLAQDMTVDDVNGRENLVFLDATRGWVLLP